jgi:molybdopterin/thiamine biosynthesis adenylyltransferase
MMPDLGAVIVPADIVDAIANDEQSQGWLGGAHIDLDNLYVVVSATLSTGVKETVALPRLSAHRCFQEGDSTDTMLRWFRVGHGFWDSFKPWQTRDRSELSVALGYQLPDGLEYLCSVEPMENSPKIRAYCLLSKQEETHIFPINIEVLYRADPYRRLPQVSVGRLSEKKIAIVGTGSGGSDLAIQFASAGVGKLALFDGERLDPANLIRHQVTRRDLGRTKVSGIASNLKERDLPTKVKEYFTNVVVWANDFRAALANERPDLVVCATDSRESRRFVNYCAVQLGIPLVIAGILDDGRIGEVICCKPRSTACYECIRLELGAALKHPSSDTRPQIPYLGGEGQDLQSGTYRFDISIVSGLATRVGLHVLDPDTFEALPTNYLVWGREKTEYDPPFRFEFPLSVNYINMPRRSDCPVCGVLPNELYGLDINTRAAEMFANIDEIPT